MALREAEQGGDGAALDVPDERADGARLLEPVALPERAGPDALVAGGLEVAPAGHGTAVDGVDDAGWGEEPPVVRVSWRFRSLCLLGVGLGQVRRSVGYEGSVSWVGEGQKE